MKPRSTQVIFILLLVFSILLGSCSSPASTQPQPVATLTPEVQTSIPETTVTSDPAAGEVTQLVIWLPDQLLARNAPVLQDLIQQQVEKFLSKHPNYQVDIRIKNNTGPANLMDVLQNTSLAAPATLPDLVLLTREEMEVAALKGLLIPYDGTTDILAANDWIEPVRTLATVQGSTFGIPVASDALIYLTPVAEGEPSSPLTDGKPILCYLNDPQAIVPLSLYLASGGVLEDETGKPVLEEMAFLSVLTQINAAKNNGSMPAWIMDITQPADVYRYFTSGRGNRMVAWYSETAEPILSISRLSAFRDITGNPATLVRGWFWAMTQTDPARRTASVELAETLAEESFLAQLDQAARLLPVRKSTAVLENPTLTAQADIVAGGQPIPNGLYLVTISPILKDSIHQLFTGSLTAEDIARQAVDRLQRP